MSETGLQWGLGELEAVDLSHGEEDYIEEQVFSLFQEDILLMCFQWLGAGPAGDHLAKRKRK